MAMNSDTLEAEDCHPDLSRTDFLASRIALLRNRASKLCHYHQQVANYVPIVIRIYHKKHSGSTGSSSVEVTVPGSVWIK